MDSPRLGAERAVLHTIAGDIVLAFYPDVAPRTVAQVLKLMRLGVYDSTHFYRVEPNFVIQLSTVQDRLLPMLPQQQAVIQRLPLETHPDIRHLRGRLSMAHMPDDQDGGETSFSILLGEAPELDGQYTVFGRVVQGDDVLVAFMNVVQDSSNRPGVRLTVDKVEVFENPSSLWRVPLVPAHSIVDPNRTDEARTVELRKSMAAGICLMIVLALVGFVCGSKLPLRQVSTLNLLNILVGVFLLFVLLQPIARETPLVGGFLFLCLIGTFKILGRFESAR